MIYEDIIYNIPISRMISVKDLRVIIDKRLTFKSHYQQNTSKYFRKLDYVIRNGWHPALIDGETDHLLETVTS